MNGVWGLLEQSIWERSPVVAGLETTTNTPRDYRPEVMFTWDFQEDHSIGSESEWKPG